MTTLNLHGPYIAILVPEKDHQWTIHLISNALATILGTGSNLVFLDDSWYVLV